MLFRSKATAFRVLTCGKTLRRLGHHLSLTAPYRHPEEHLSCPPSFYRCHRRPRPRCRLADSGTGAVVNRPARNCTGRSTSHRPAGKQICAANVRRPPHSSRQESIPQLESLSLKHTPKSDHKTPSELELERLETRLRTVQLALEILTGMCATLPDPEVFSGAPGGEDDNEGASRRIQASLHSANHRDLPHL